MRHRLLVIVAVAMAGLLILAACDSTSDESSADGDNDAGDNGETSEVSDTDSDNGESSEDSDDESGSGESSDVAAGESDLDRPIVFAHYNWDGPMFHNRVAQFILEEGYGYETETTPGSTIPLFQGQIEGDIDVSMEIWLDQMPPFEPAVEDGEIVDLGSNFEGGTQGWYVPTYVIEGDEERGIDPIAPDLESVNDLPEHKDIFADPEDPEKGRIYDGPAGWEAERVHEAKMKGYGLNEHFNRFLPGSEAALHTSMISAYEEGEPWVGYQWVPSWVTGLYDLTKLEEPEYTDECWAEIEAAVEDGSAPDQACAWPLSDVNIAVTDEFAEAAPDVTEFLENYGTTLEQNEAALAYMTENEADHWTAATWFLQEYEDTWTEWVPDEVADNVRAALEEQ